MVLGLLAVASIGAAAPPPDALPADPGPTADGEIIVTGERVPRTIRETPSSVVALTADAIEATSADRLDQILEMIPNVQVGSGEEGPAIRGQDSTGVLRGLFAFLGGTRPRVTVQIDGRPVTYYEYVSGAEPLWDIERVEVWRSPQTTTQGRNSIAGAIFIETADPTFDWEGRARAIVGGLGTRQVSGVVSGPVVTDRLAFRVSGDLHRGRMASDMVDAIPGADIARDDYAIVRAKLLLTPAALPGARIETSYVHTASQAPQFEAVIRPFENRSSPVPQMTNGIHRINTDSVTARWHHEAGALTSDVTLSFGDTQVRRFGLPGLGQTTVDSQDYSKEAIVRWRSDDDRLSVLGGVNQIVTRQKQTIDITGLGIGAGGFQDRQTSLGIFGEATWKPAAPLAITGGLRRQSDRQRRIGQVGPATGGLKLDYGGHFDAWLGKLSLAYDLSDATTAGVMVQRAYSPGGTSFNIRLRRQDTFEEERVWSGEMFFRSRFAQDRGTIAMNLFYNAIEDAQRVQDAEIVVPGSTSFFFPEFGNAPRSRTRGLEVEGSYRPVARLTARFGLGLLRTRIIEAAFSSDATLGKEFQRSPHLSASAALDWRPVDAIRISVAGRHHSGYFSDDKNNAALRIGSQTVVDVRGEYTAGRVKLFGYLRNALDAFYLTYLFNPDFGTAGDPREAGLGIEARF